MSERVGGSASSPVAVSPLVAAGAGVVVDGWEVPAPAGEASGAADVTAVDLCPWTKVQVRGDADLADLLGVGFGRTSEAADRLVVGSGPGEWLVLAAPGRAQELVDQLVARVGPGTTVIDQTHGRALVRVSGAGTLSVLQRLTAMDLDDRFVPDGSAFRTSVAGVVADVVRHDDDGPSYLIHCERSSGRYLVGCLLAVGEDRGATLVGRSSYAWG